MYNKKLTVFLLVFMLVLSLVPSTFVFAQEDGTSAQNPILWADVPDCSIIRVGEAYYMSSTTMHMNPGVPIMKSTDLVNWEIVNYVYDILGDKDEEALRNGKNEYSKGSWASSLKYHNGKFYVVFASYTEGKTFIFQTTDIERGPWERYTLDGVYHDMSLVFDNDGRTYLIYGGGDIKLIELTPDATAIKEGAVSKIIIPNSSSIAGGTTDTLSEGAQVSIIDGKYYVFLITWPSGKSRTQICYRADSIDGQYEGKVLLEKGVAQGGIVDTPNGDWYALLFRDNGPVGRTPYIIPVTWEDGWPTLQQDVLDTGVPVTKANYKIIESDEFNQRSQKVGAYHTVIESSNIPVTPPADPEPLPIEEGREIIVNGDIESGLESWLVHENASMAVTTDSILTTTNSILTITNRKSTGSGPQQYLTGKVKAGGIYKFSAKVKYDATSAPNTRQFIMSFQDGNWETIKNMGSTTLNKGQWGIIEGTYTIPEDLVLNEPLIFIETSWTQAQDPINDLMDFYVEDVSFIDVTPNSNIIKNSGFNDGTNLWSVRETATISVDNEGSNNILAVTGRTSTGSGPQQFITGKVEGGKTYKFTTKVKYVAEAAPATKQFNITFQDAGSYPNWTIKDMGKVINKGEWGTIEGTYTIPETADLSSARIFIETPYANPADPNKDLMDFYVDDVSVTDVTPVNVDTIKDGENDYNGSNLGLVWQWNHNPNNNLWSLTARPGYLRLTTGSKSTSLLDARNTLTQRTFGPQSSANIAMDISNMKDGDFSGLTALQYYYGYVGVKMTGTSKSIVMVKGSSNNPNNPSTPVEVASIPVNQSKVYFKIDCDYMNSANKAYFYYSLDGTSWTAIGESISMVYTMPHFMGYRFGLFNYATKTIGGYVDFDYFRVEDRITGEATASTLNANLEDVSNILGVQNIEFTIPVKMDELPAGDYKSIEASFTIPEPFAVEGVVFNTENITGTGTYTYANNQLNLKVTGDSVGFVNQSSNKLFATIKLKVKKFVPEDKTISITTDYIKVDGGSLVYNVHNAVAQVELKKLNTNAVAKVPGYSNPIMTHKLGADPWAMEYNGRVYVYASSDDYEYDSNGNIKGNSFARLNRVRVMSSEDMVNWTDHGDIPVAGRDADDNGGKGIAQWAGDSWAPAAAHKVIDGKEKFFLYFANGGGGIGVLTSDSPIGPWKDELGKALITQQTPGVAGVVWLFDPAVLIDDDGKGYIYFGGGIPGGNTPTQAQIEDPQTGRVMELGDDMISVVGTAKTLDIPFLFEDSGIHKYNGKYYYSYCINFSGVHPQDKIAGEIAYMISDNPMGPFTYVKSILKNPSVFFGVGGNNHHTVFKFNDKWYIAYHAQTVRKALGITGDGYRSVHINKVEYYDNGKIKDVAGDMQGISQLKNLDPYKRTEAETIGWNAGILTEECTAPGYPVESNKLNVTDIHNGDWIAVSNADFGSKGAGKFAASVAATVGGKIEIRLDSPQGNLIGTLDVAPTGGEQAWELMECDVENVKGVHSIFFVFTGEGGNNLLNMDYWKFTEAEPAPTVIPLESISITGAVSSLEVNDELIIGSEINPTNATDPTYQWTASGAITTVGDTNKNEVTIKGISEGAGTLTLTVSAGDVEKSTVIEITVTSSDIEEPVIVPVESVKITGETVTVDVNNTLNFGSTINPTNATNPTYRWTAGEGISVVGDSTKNNVTIKGMTVGAGKLTLTVITGETEKKDEINITVSPVGGESGSVTGVTLDKNKISLVVGTSEALTAVIDPVNATNKNVIWTSSDNSIVQVNTTGKAVTVTGIAAGTATITVTTADGNKTASCVVTVSNKPGGGSSSHHATKPTTPVVPVTIPPANQNPTVSAEVAQVSLSLANGTAVVEGKKIELSVKPYIENGRTVVGIRDMANLLQIDSKNIIWNAKTKTVVIKSNGKNIELVIDQKYAIVDGEKVALDVAPQIKNGRTVLPVALVARIMAIKVQFDTATKDVTFSIAK